MPGVTRRQAAAVSVRGQCAADAQFAVLDERPALAFVTEAESFDCEQHLDVNASYS